MTKRLQRQCRYCKPTDSGASAMSCQKMAWKKEGAYDQAVSHRDICPMLRLQLQMAKEDTEERKRDKFDSLYYEMVAFSFSCL